MYSYWSGGHNKAERVAMHATIFTFATFIVTICIWSASIGIMQGSRSNNNDKDLWGWSCKDNVRKQLFQDTVNYDLVCRQQDWVIVCAVIEISLELLIVAVYLFAFYRIVYSKRKLRKSLSVRDEARSSLWLAKLQSQKDEDIAAEDRETTMNTTYNQLNSNTAYINAEEGCAVPILKAPPLGHHYKRTDASEIPSVLGETTNWSDVPPTPRSVNFTNRSDVPPTPRSVCFQELPRPVTSGSRER